MANEQNIWYQVGYALERARSRGMLSGGQAAGDGSAPARRSEKRSEPVPPSTEGGKPAPSQDHGSLESLIEKALGLATVTGGGVLAAAALRAWRPRSRPGPFALMKASAAGAGAAVARMAFRALLGVRAPGQEAEDPMVPVLAGAARGMLYATVVEPRLPGPVVLRGAAYGAAEYLAEPWGGLEGFLGHVPAHRRIPLLAALLEAHDQDPSLGGHLVFGVVMASLYGQGRSG